MSEGLQRPAMLRTAIRPKYVLFLLSLLSPLATICQTQWQHVETVTYDWNHDHKPFTLVLELPKNWDAGGDYSRLRILTPNGKYFTFTDTEGLTTLSQALGSNWAAPHLAALLGNNPVPSHYLLFLPMDSHSEKPFLLLLFGWPYGSSPGSLHAISLEKGVPREILHREEFQVRDYLDLNGDGNPEIVGWPCLSQAYGAGLTTYDPFWVFTLPRDGLGLAHISIPLSKKYNLEHYYGWAGSKCSEKLAVVLHPPGGGKPIIMNARKAEKLMDNEKPGKR